MKKVLLIVGMLVISAYGQAPLTYSARTDNCEDGTQSLCGSGLGKGPPLSYLGRWSDKLPSAPALGLYGMNKCWIDPDFGSKVCRATDYSLNKVARYFNVGSNGVPHVWSSDSKMLLVMGGQPAVLAFSADSNMHTALTGLTGLPGAAYAFSMTNPTLLYEYMNNLQNGAYVNQINQLTIDNTDPNPANWTIKSRVKLFNLNCEGTGCPTVSANQFYTNGYNVGTSSAFCLPANYRSTWQGIFVGSYDDSSFTVALSSNGQGGSGAIWVVNYTVGKGCRAMSTTTMTVNGDYGPTGAMINAQTNTPLVDKGFVLHETIQLPDSKEASFTPATGGTNQCTIQANCSCTVNGSPSWCNSYYWQVQTLMTQPCTPSYCQGHYAPGYVNDYRAKYYTAINYYNPLIPGAAARLFPVPIPVDQHGSYNNSGTSDQTPVFLTTTKVCGQASGAQGSTPCDPQYTGPYYDEIIAGQNFVANPSAANCNYGSGPVGCMYRIAHPVNSGTNWNFNIQNAIGATSPDGRWTAFASDADKYDPVNKVTTSALGCTNGATVCLDPVTASTNNYCPLNNATAACQRGDIFIVDNTSARLPNSSPSPSNLKSMVN